MEKFRSFSDSSVTEKVTIPEEYAAYLEQCWDNAKKNQIRAWQELGGKQLVYRVK